MLSPTIEVGEVAQFYSVGVFFCESAGGYPTPTPILRQQTATSALEELELEGAARSGLTIRPPRTSAVPPRVASRGGRRAAPWRAVAGPGARPRGVEGLGRPAGSRALLGRRWGRRG